MFDWLELVCNHTSVVDDPMVSSGGNPSASSISLLG